MFVLDSQPVKGISRKRFLEKSIRMKFIGIKIKTNDVPHLTSIYSPAIQCVYFSRIIVHNRFPMYTYSCVHISLIFHMMCNKFEHNFLCSVIIIIDEKQDENKDRNVWKYYDEYIVDSLLLFKEDKNTANRLLCGLNCRCPIAIAARRYKNNARCFSKEKERLCVYPW